MSGRDGFGLRSGDRRQESSPISRSGHRADTGRVSDELVEPRKAAELVPRNSTTAAGRAGEGGNAHYADATGAQPTGRAKCASDGIYEADLRAETLGETCNMTVSGMPITLTTGHYST